MNEKSQADRTLRKCLVCERSCELGPVLLSTGRPGSAERHLMAGWGLCPEHEKLYLEGFVALVECDPASSGAPASGGTMKPSEVVRTGLVAYLTREVAHELFAVPAAFVTTPCIFVEKGIIALLKSHLPGTAH